MSKNLVKIRFHASLLFAVLIICIWLSFSQSSLALDILPQDVISYIQDNIEKQDIDYKNDKNICLTTNTGAEKLVCKMKRFPFYALEVCRKAKLKIKDVGEIDCYNFIDKQINNLNKLQQVNVDIVKTFTPGIVNLNCAKTGGIQCSGFVQEWQSGILREKNLYISYIEKEQNSYKEASNEQKRFYCTKYRFQSLFEDDSFINLLYYVNAKSQQATAFSIEKIWAYMFPNKTSETSYLLPPYHLILDLQGFLVNNGKFLVNDPDGVLTIEGDGKETFYQATKGQVPYCWYSFMSALLE